VQADVKRILDLYRRSGRFAATVEPKVIQLPQNRVDLVFEINEGKLTGIDSINFVGNKAFANGDLQHIISTKESRWYRFLSRATTPTIPIASPMTASCCANITCRRAMPISAWSRRWPS
jgi:outer membrane protein insertion porin family